MKTNQTMTGGCGLLVVVALINSFPQCQAGNLPENESTQNMTLTLGLLVPFTVEWTVGNAIASAIVPAIDAVHERGLLPGYDIQWSVGDSGCVANMGKSLNFFQPFSEDCSTFFKHLKRYETSIPPHPPYIGHLLSVVSSEW